MINGFVYTVDKLAQATETMIDKMANFGTNAINKAAVLGSKTMEKMTNVSSSAVNSLVNVGTHAGTQLTEVAKGTIAEVGQTTGSLGVYIGFGVGAAVLVVVMANKEFRIVGRKEIFIVKLNRIFPLNHFNLMYSIDRELGSCVQRRIIDIKNMVKLEYGVDYECVTVEMFLNLYKDQRPENKVELFCGQNVKELIYNYSNSIHFKTDASINMIKPFTNICLTYKKALDLQIKEKVYVFTSEAVQKGMIYYGECCCVKYYPNAYVRRSRRIITLEALYGKKYLYLDGDVEWGCGIRPEMIKDNNNPGYWKGTIYCAKHLCLTRNTHKIVTGDDYDDVECNVSSELYRLESPIRVLEHFFRTIERFSPLENVPRLLIYDNACGLHNTFFRRYNTDIINHTAASNKLATMKFVVDKFHHGNHKREMCKYETNPYKYSELDNINTEVSEQVNAKLKHYKNALSSYSAPT
ncbi:unnamed protein product, partial [Didymodactylos carnosus]